MIAAEDRAAQLALRRIINKLASLLALADPPDPFAFVRVSGEIICDHCGRCYYDHAPHPTHRFLQMACDGRLLKL